MKAIPRRSFERDLKKFAKKEKSKNAQQRIRQYIEEFRTRIEGMESLQEISRQSDIKKMHGGEGCYRARIGDYRLGLQVAEGGVEFVRFLHRRDIYKYFP